MGLHGQSGPAAWLSNWPATGWLAAGCAVGIAWLAEIIFLPALLVLAAALAVAVVVARGMRIGYQRDWRSLPIATYQGSGVLMVWTFGALLWFFHVQGRGSTGGLGGISAAAVPALVIGPVSLPAVALLIGGGAGIGLAVRRWRSSPAEHPVTAGGGGAPDPDPVQPLSR